MLMFKSAFYKNFMSTGNQGLKVELNRAPSTLVGGLNGSGKSTLLEAITYALFGKTLKKINLGGIINSINKKNLEVHIEFDKNGKSYKIVRGEKPKKLEFYIDGELQDQTAKASDYQAKIEYVLGMDYKLFTQVCILNKERYVPFMEMGASDRRKVVEDILDINVFSFMSDILKREAKDLSMSIDDLKYSRDRTIASIASTKRLIAEAQSNIDERRAEAQSEIDAMESNELAKATAEVDRINSEIDSIEDPKADHAKAIKRKKDFEEIAINFRNKMKSLDEKIAFISNNDNCPTCKQVIDEEFKNSSNKESQEELNKLKDNSGLMAVEYKKAVDKFNALEQAVSDLKTLTSDLRYATQQKETIERNIFSKKKLLATIVANPKLTTYENEQVEFEETLLSQEEELTKLIEKSELYKVISSMLKDDGIKSSIVKDYIGFINIRLNEYLNSMNFFLNITLNENFEEKINSINRENFTIDNLSTGQKCRVNLAIWMALLEVSSLKNSAVTNLIALDEVLENLDQNGVQDFMKLVNDKLSHKNLFVVTQRFDEFQDYFRSSLRFKLNDGFTEIVK